MRALLAASMIALLAAPAVAQFQPPSNGKGPRPDREQTQFLRVGVIIRATGGSIQRVIATAPVPGEWPEQKVSVAKEDVSSVVRSLTYRTVTGGGSVRQMVVEIPQLPKGAEARALITFEVTRQTLAPPADTTIYTIPKKLDRELTINIGSSPYIESRHPKIASAAREAVAEVESDWQKVEAIYDWARDHVAYKTDKMKGAARALYEKEGDVDDLTSLFIAMCRAQKIPARTVFVYRHCYAEFYLQDDTGQGHWFPCQPAGARAFGQIDNAAPILQKGDNFKNPENRKERLRYLTEYFYAAGRGQEPKVQFVCEMVADE